MTEYREVQYDDSGSSYTYTTGITSSATTIVYWDDNLGHVQGRVHNFAYGYIRPHLHVRTPMEPKVVDDWWDIWGINEMGERNFG